MFSAEELFQEWLKMAFYRFISLFQFQKIIQSVSLSLVECQADCDFYDKLFNKIGLI